MIGLEEKLNDNYIKWQNRAYIYEKVDGMFRATTYGAFLDRSRKLAAHLLSLQLAEQPVMIYGDNSTKLMVADFAVLNYVGVSVCVSKEWKAADLLRAIRLLGIPCVIYGAEKKEVIDRVREALPGLIYISMDSMEEICNDTEMSGELEPREEHLCCKIVFSSGTTANPKAVMLSKKNVFAGMESLYRRCPFNEGDVDYLFLPLSHTYGGIYNFLYSLVFGFSIYLCSNVTNMAGEILEVNPTLFCAVPAIYRKFYEGYGSNIYKAFGSRIQYLFCGGAYFEEEIRKAYKDSGLNIMEAYALSETASTFAIQYPGDPDCQSVGTIAEDIEARIWEPDEKGMGEIVVKGDNVFMGYAGDREQTLRAFTEDGYFKTGDMGYILPDERNGGYKLYITGRKKRILIGENGQNVDPAHIENLICKKNPNISKALVYMQENKLCCHIYLFKQGSRDWDVFFTELNDTLPKYEQIRQYDIAVDSVEKRLKQ